MQAFNVEEGIVIPLDRPNVDTDAIIPKQFLKSIKRTGFGPNLFDEWRYLDRGEPGVSCESRPLNHEFVLNQPHAVWALDDFGIRVVIAPSFADIFFNNTSKNGILAIVLDETVIDTLFDAVNATEGYSLKVDLSKHLIQLPDGTELSFDINAFKKECLMKGLDDIGLTMQHTDAIEAYEKRRQQETPWLFPSA